MDDSSPNIPTESSLAALYSSLSLPSNTKSIRVIDIQPARKDDEAVVGKLRVVDIEEDPDFTSLSYVWGLPEPHGIINCNGVDMNVTSNCVSALTHLRTKLGAFSIWVDAICINQNDLKEKSLQVPLMGDIYSRCTTVYIWLGEGDASTKRVVNYLNGVGFADYYVPNIKGPTDVPNESRSRPLAAAWSLYRSRWSLSRHPIPFMLQVDKARLFKPFFLHTRKRHTAPYATSHEIERLLRRRWITRLWTYQEILLASNPVVVCGTSHILWDQFARSIVFLERMGWAENTSVTLWKRIVVGRNRMMAKNTARPYAFDIDDYEAFIRKVKKIESRYSDVAILTWVFTLCGNIAYSVCGLFVITPPYFIPNILIYLILAWCVINYIIRYFRIHHQLELKGPMHKVEDMIEGLYSRNAGQPKDMAFGMWAILQTLTRSSMPAPDYAQPLGEIYKTFTQLLIEATKSPLILLLSAIQGMPDQPSWVPDWSANSTHTWRDRGTIRDIVQSASLNFTDPCNTISLLRAETTNPALSIHARQIGTIKSSYTFRSTNPTYDPSEHQTHLNNLHAILKLTYRFWGVLDTISYITPPESIDIKSHAYWCWKRFLDKCRDSPDPDVMLSHLVDNPGKKATRGIWLPGGVTFFSVELRSRVTYGEILRIHVAMCNMMARMGKGIVQMEHPFESGKTWEAWSNLGVRVGDIVVLVERLEAPLVFRRIEGEDGRRVRVVGPLVLVAPFEMTFVQKLEKIIEKGGESNVGTLEEFHVY